MRTFLAVRVSDDTRKLLIRIREQFSEFGSAVRFVPPQNVHLTLKFLGEIDPDLTGEICDRVKLAVENVINFAYICEGTGTFPINAYPRVLWIGITKGREMLAQLSQQLNQALLDLPVKKEQREFSSHITLGRVKRRNLRREAINRFRNYSFAPISNPVSELIFFESQLTPRGAIYKPIHQFPLKER